MRDDGDLDQGGDSGIGGKWSDSSYNLKVEPQDFLVNLTYVIKENQSTRTTPKFLA